MRRNRPQRAPSRSRRSRIDELTSSQWRSLLQHLDSRVFILDEDFTVLFANESASHLVPAALEGRRCHQVLHGLEVPCRNCPATLLLAPSVEGQLPEHRRCRKVRCFPLEREEGRTTLLAVELPAVDSSPGEAGRGPRAWLAEILRDWGAPVVATSPDGTILVFNEEAEELLGYESEILIGQMRAGAFLVEGDGTELLEKLRSDDYGGKGKLLSENVHLVHACGHTVAVTLRGAVLSDGDEELAIVWFLQSRIEGRPSTLPEDPQQQQIELERTVALQHLAAGLAHQLRNPLTGTVLFSNILMQELVRRELQRADAFLWNLIQSSVDAVIATDTQGNIFIFNDEACRVLGYDADEVVGKYHISTIYPIEEAREIMRRLRSDEYGDKGKLRAHDMELIHKNGEKIPVRLNASLVHIHGREFGSVGFFRDQRQRMKMEKELKAAHVQLLQSEKMASLGKLAAGIAHQINNPLSGIMLFSNLLLENEEMPHEWGTDLKRIADEAERCRSIVKELLEFARQTEQKVKRVDINRALGQTIFLLEKQVLFQNIEIVKDFDPGTPEICADPQQLNHVYMNLILNAAEAMEGQGTLTLRTRPCEAPMAAEFQICDTGTGIPPEIQSKIYEPFFTTKDIGKGTGLGLAMVYGILEQHGGTIDIESREGEGAAFIVRLPLGQVPTE